MHQKRLPEDKRRQNGKGRLAQEEYKRLKPLDVAQELQEHKSIGTSLS